MLDHGTYLDLPVELRCVELGSVRYRRIELKMEIKSRFLSMLIAPSQLPSFRELFCQLWCSFAACDLQVRLETYRH